MFYGAPRLNIQKDLCGHSAAPRTTTDQELRKTCKTVSPRSRKGDPEKGQIKKCRSQQEWQEVAGKILVINCGLAQRILSFYGTDCYRQGLFFCKGTYIQDHFFHKNHNLLSLPSLKIRADISLE